MESIAVLTMVVFGGMGNLAGVVVGALALTAPCRRSCATWRCRCSRRCSTRSSSTRKCCACCCCPWPAIFMMLLRRRTGRPTAAIPGPELVVGKPARGAGQVITLLEAKHVTKRFGGLRPRPTSPDHPQGRVYGLIGPNGAGKTTFFNVLTGAYVPEEGEIVSTAPSCPPANPRGGVPPNIRPAPSRTTCRLFRELTALET